MVIISMITHIPISQDGFDNGEPDQPHARGEHGHHYHYHHHHLHHYHNHEGEHGHLPDALVQTCPTW